MKDLLLNAMAGGSIAMALSVAGKAAHAHDGAHPPDLEALAGHFAQEALVGSPKIVDCQLSGGAQTRCHSITVRPQPGGFAMGPWCPRNIADDAEAGGIWIHKGEIHDVDGAFIRDAAAFFDDDAWRLYDPETGAVHVTDTEEACRAAARPDVAPEYQNHCVECAPDYVSADQSLTYVIPLEPVAASKSSGRLDHAGVGLSFSGARLDAAAPLDAILRARTVAPFDDCGGHVNPVFGYHIHAVTDCLATVPSTDDHPPMIGVALDGHAIYHRAAEDAPAPADLDACSGHASDELGYHYHAGSPGSNAIIGCHKGQRGCVLDDPDQECARSWVGWLGSWFE